MPKTIKKILKVVGYSIGGLIALLLILFIYLVIVSKVNPPHIADKSSLQLKRIEVSPGFYAIKNNWFRRSNSGLFELYVEGQPFERGVINGKLTKELVVKQEDYFSDQINKMIPSKFYLHFLKYFVGWFNRNLDKNVTEEYKEEIYGISGSASDKYDYIGTNYQRILNYHAAHDIGHALQNLALVGCTSFGTWDAKSADSEMIIGRNFDFYVGDSFSINKIVGFFNPSSGHKFMTITWAGFIGAVSGMNDQGVTVTINADKSSIPSASATPVSLVAREILQYSANLSEAIAIAKKRKMFVSESFLVGSAADNKAIIIEKTPDSLEIFDPHGDSILCANHFQSAGLGNSAPNMEFMKESASTYRYKRLQQLLQAAGKNTVQKTVTILRDRKGMDGSDIGLGNEKSVNQLIAHHSVVFEPKKRLVWISTAPWQLGKYVAYDLNKVFTLKGMRKDEEIHVDSLTVPADEFLGSDQFHNYERFLMYKKELLAGNQINSNDFIASNPNFYYTYVLLGDYFYNHKEYEQAKKFYRTALSKVVATKKEEEHIQIQVKNCEKH